MKEIGAAGHQLSLTLVISKRSTRSSAPWPKRFGPPANEVGNAYGGRGIEPGVSGRQPAVEQREQRHAAIQLPWRGQLRSAAMLDDRRRAYPREAT